MAYSNLEGKNVVIIGGGPAGLSVARALQQTASVHGLRVGLFEKDDISSCNSRPNVCQNCGKLLCASSHKAIFHNFGKRWGDYCNWGYVDTKGCDHSGRTQKLYCPVREFRAIVCVPRRCFMATLATIRALSQIFP